VPNIILPEIQINANDGLAENAIRIALSQEGVREINGSNSGPEVDQYLACVHAAPGNPWCSAFASWCIKKAATDLGITPELTFSASTYGLWTKNPTLQMATPTDNCIFLIDHGLSKQGNRIGHVGLVVSVNGNGLETIEGNTNAGGSRNGDGVYRRTRQVSEITYGFMKIQ
jgi:hypothetical protein